MALLTQRSAASQHVAARSTSKQPPHQEFREDVAGLRGLAISMVLGDHTGGNIHGGVDISFVISGFLMVWLALKEEAKHGHFRIGRYYAGRARRIFPSAALVGVATLVASCFILSRLRLKEVAVDGLWAALSVANFRFAIQSNNYFAPKEQSLYLHWWSLSIEEQFYLFWPWLLVAMFWVGQRVSRRSGKWHLLPLCTVLVGLVGGSLLLMTVTNHASQPWAYYNILCRVWELGVGALVAALSKYLSRLPQMFAAIMSWAGLATLLVAGVLVTNNTPLPFYGLGAVVGSALLIAGGCAKPRFGAILALNNRPLKYIGNISYQLYLWHWPVLLLLPVALGWQSNLTTKLLVVAVSVALAALTRRFWDQRFRTNRAYVETPSKGLALGLNMIAWPVAFALAAIFVLAPSTSSSAKAMPKPTQSVSEIAQLVQAGTQLQSLTPDMLKALPSVPGDSLDNCINPFDATTPKPCVIGDVTSSTVMVLVGDSHATQWKPALDIIAKKYHIRLVTFAKAACTPEPYKHIDNGAKREYYECEKWRDNVFRLVEQQLHPKAVILSSAIYTGASGDATASVVSRLRKDGMRVAVFDDTIIAPFDVPECLSKNRGNVQKCSTSRSQGVYMPDIRKTREQATLKSGGTFVKVLDWFCTPTICPPVIGGLFVYVDSYHISNTYSAWLAPQLESALMPVLN